MDAGLIRNIPAQTVVGMGKRAPVTTPPAEKKLQGARLEFGQKKFPLPLDGRPLTLGRATNNQVTFEPNRVSRNHAQLKFQDGQLFLMDVGSTFGTTVNGEKLEAGKWVPVKTEDKIELAGIGIQLAESHAEDSIDFRSSLEMEVKGPAPNPKAVGQKPVAVGRSSDSDVEVLDGKVSRYHAQVRFEDGALSIQDLNSLNGTRVGGQSVPANQWKTITPEATVSMGDSLLKFQPRMTMPDGREALVTPLPDGKVKVDKITFALPDSEIADMNLNTWGTAEKVGGPEELKVGQEYLSIKGNRIHNLTYYGRDQQGHHRLGHSDTYKPEEFNRYLQEQARYIRETAEARVERLDRRDQNAADLREKEIGRLDLKPDLQDPEKLAQKLFVGQGKLASDGRDLWDKPVLDRVTELKRGELEGDPEVADRGLVDLRLEQWLAQQRGEMLLFRGIREEYDAAADTATSHYADGLGTALHTYAMHDSAKESNVLVARVPTSDAFRLQIQVGSLPGLNPYAAVVGLHPEKVDYPYTPKLVISSKDPKQDWIFREYKALDNMDKGDAQVRMGQLDRQIVGN